LAAARRICSRGPPHAVTDGTRSPRRRAISPTTCRALTDVAGNPPGFINISARLTLDDFRDGLEKLQAVAVV